MSTSNVKSNFGDLFLEANLEAIDEVLSKCTQPYIPTKEFEQKIQKMIYGERPKVVTKKLPLRKKIAVALIASLILALVGCVWANHKEIGAFFQEFFETHFNLTVNVEETGQYPSTLEKVYHPSYIPEGYEQTEYDADIMQVYACWELSDTERIIFKQNVIKHDNIFFDNEGTYTEVFTVGDYQVFYVKDNVQSSYMWHDGEYLFELIAICDLSQEEAIRIIDSITEKIE